MAYIMYVIRSDTGRRYTGSTSDLEKRLQRHNGELPRKKSSYTRNNGNEWTLKYKEEYPTRTEAEIREKQLKGYQGRRFIQSIIDNSGR